MVLDMEFRHGDCVWCLDCAVAVVDFMDKVSAWCMVLDMDFRHGHRVWCLDCVLDRRWNRIVFWVGIGIGSCFELGLGLGLVFLMD